MLNLATLLGFKKKLTIPGKHCTCEAYGQCECGCGADWTDYSTWNKAVEELEKLSPDVERLAAILYKTKGGESSSLTDTDRLMIMEECYREAKLTINSIPKWVVRKV